MASRRKSERESIPAHKTIMVISDSTGKTARQLLSSALTQFSPTSYTVKVYGQVTTPRQIQDIVSDAARQDSLIMHTLVQARLRKVVLQESRKHGVDAMDLMGPLLDRLGTYLGTTPTEQPGLFQHSPEGKSREIEAVEFTFRHDDGQNAHELYQAEIVLVGVSRTMKTPTSLYLAYHGWFVGNFPLVPGAEVPMELIEIDSRKVFFLDMVESQLFDLRQNRATASGISSDSYASLNRVHSELAQARELCRRHGWAPVDVTGKSVEEVSREILVLRAERIPSKDATTA